MRWPAVAKAVRLMATLKVSTQSNFRFAGDPRGTPIGTSHKPVSREFASNRQLHD